MADLKRQLAEVTSGSLDGDQILGRVHKKRLAKENKFWYKPSISREEAIAVVKSGAPGAFIVRDSNRDGRRSESKQCLPAT